MGKKIGVQPTLTPIKEFLNEKGYDVVDLTNGVGTSNVDYKQFDAVVVTGMSKNFLNMQDTATDAVVINASGRTAVEVENEIKSRTK